MQAKKTLAEQLTGIILGRLAADRLELPPMPQVATGCLTMMRDANVQLKQVAKAIERDPVLALQVLRQANSAFYGGSLLASIDQAVTRLGIQKMKTLLVEASASRLFDSRDKRIATAFRSIWEHSLAVAILARDLAALFGDHDGDAAYLAGLLHDVGKPILAAVLLEAEHQLAHGPGGWIDSNAWLEAVQGSHHKIGVALAEKWRLPDVVQRAMRECGEFDSSNRASPANFVCFANALSKVNGFYPGTPDLDEARALVMIGRSMLGVEDDVVTRLVTGLKERSQAPAGAAS